MRPLPAGTAKIETSCQVYADELCKQNNHLLRYPGRLHMVTHHTGPGLLH